MGSIEVRQFNIKIAESGTHQSRKSKPSLVVPPIRYRVPIFSEAEETS
jgi:hypothetical protein